MKSKKPKGKPVSKKNTGTKRSKFWYFPLLVFVLAIAQYSNTLTHDYAWDDELVITKNSETQKGLSGLGNIWTEASYISQRKIYRPVTQTFFALERQFFGNNPTAGHGFNILYYALCSVLLFLVLKKLFRKTHAVFLLAITALFIVHPVHTEVVANIKSRDEIFALLFGLGSIYFFIKYLDASKIRDIFIAGLLLCLGCLSKINTITLLGFFPVLFFFRKMQANPRIDKISVTRFLNSKISAEPVYAGNGFAGKITAAFQNMSGLQRLLYWLCPVVLLFLMPFGFVGIPAFVAMLFPVLYFVFFDNKENDVDSVVATVLIIASGIMMQRDVVLLFFLLFVLLRIARRGSAAINLKSLWPAIATALAYLVFIDFYPGIFIVAGLFLAAFLLVKKQPLAVSGLMLLLIGLMVYFEARFLIVLSVLTLLGALLIWKSKIRMAHLLVLMMLQASLLPAVLLKLDNLPALPKNELNTGLSQIKADDSNELPFDITNNILLTAPDAGVKYATIMDIQLRYLGKLFYPHPLIHQYGYNSIPLRDFGDISVRVSLLLHAFLLLAGVFFFFRGNPIGLGIAFYIITISIYTNMVKLAPDTMAERFLFMASVGFCIAFVFAVKQLFQADFKGNIFSGKANLSFFTIVGVLTVAFFVKTIDRNKDWKNPVTLVSNTLPHAPDNAALHAIYAAEWDKYLRANPREKNADEIRTKMVAAQERAIEIYPQYYNAMIDLGASYIKQNRLGEAKDLFSRAGKVNPQHPLSPLYLGFIALQERRNEDCISLINSALEKNEKVPDAYKLLNYNYKQALIFLGRAYAFTGQMNRAKATLESGNSKFPRDADFMKILARLQEQQGDLEGAVESYKKGIAINQDDIQLKEKLSELYGKMKQ